jgi:hypothetical protein
MSTKAQVRPDQATARPTPSALASLESAQHGLMAAMHETSAANKSAAAHLAALRAAAAVVATKSDPRTSGRRKRPQNVWELLAKVEPALSGWAAYFAATAMKRTAAETGLRHAVSLREADKLLRDAETFVSLAAGMLSGSAHPVPQPPTPTAPNALPTPSPTSLGR